MLAPLAFMFFFSFRIHAISAATAQTLFWVFCALIGLSLAAVFRVFTGTSIARTFFITAAMFGTTSLYGYTAKRDLSSMGSFLLMGLIGVIIASLVNLFSIEGRCCRRSAKRALQGGILEELLRTEGGGPSAGTSWRPTTVAIR